MGVKLGTIFGNRYAHARGQWARLIFGGINAGLGFCITFSAFNLTLSMKNILVPTDFSENAKGAMVYAIQLAAALKAKLYFYHATGRVIPRIADKRQYDDYKTAYLADHLAFLQKSVLGAYHELGIEEQASQAELLIREGEFTYHVGDAIREHQIDLVVMGTHGASGLKRWFFGSNAAEVFEQAPCPVLTVPEGYRYGLIKRIGYASDLVSVPSDFGQIVNFARLFRAQVTLFHVYPVYPEEVELARLDKHALLENLKRQFDYEAIDLELVRTEEDNDVEGGIEHFVQQFAPSLLVMFNRERSWFDRVLDPSNTKEMIMTAQVPLLAFKS